MDNKDNLTKIIIDDTVYATQITKKFAKRKPYTPPNPKELRAFIPGTIRDIFCNAGKIVNQGEPLLILEAMKMMNTVVSPVSGKIKTISVSSGSTVAKNQLLLEFE